MALGVIAAQSQNSQAPSSKLHKRRERRWLLKSRCRSRRLKKLLQRDPKEARPLLVNFWATWCDGAAKSFLISSKSTTIIVRKV
jgi:hypothetical protein